MLDGSRVMSKISLGVCRTAFASASNFVEYEAAKSLSCGLSVDLQMKIVDAAIAARVRISGGAK